MARILIVEDNVTNLKLASFVLENAGHEILQAGDAVTGINLTRAYHPDLVLMDIQLPGMDGLTATRKLKNDAPTANIKILALTACAMSGDERRTREAGCDGYIPKPFRHRELLQLVNAALA